MARGHAGNAAAPGGIARCLSANHPPTQELSPQKRAAIRWLLDSHARLLAAAENALETHPIDPADYRRRHAGDLAPDGEQMCAAIEGLKAAIEAAGGGT